MPLYEHKCDECGAITSHVCKIAERKQEIPCDKCGAAAKRVVGCNIQRDEPTWLASAVSNLADEDAPKIRDRNDFNRYLDKNGIVQVG